jgi:DNA-binding CsgD family transcriptional regulator
MIEIDEPSLAGPPMEESSRPGTWVRPKPRGKRDHGLVAQSDRVPAVPSLESQWFGADAMGVQTTFADRYGGDAPALLVRVAERLAPTDGQLAREVYLEALGLGISAARLGSDLEPIAVARAARTAPAPPASPRVLDLLLDGLVARVTEGYFGGLLPLRRALRAYAASGESDETRRWRWLMFRVALDLWDDQLWFDVIRREGDRAPLDGSVAGAVTMDDLHSSQSAPAMEVSRGIDSAVANHPASWRRQLSPYSLAVVGNGLGHYGEALSAAQRASDRDDLGVKGWALAELVEAAVRTGHRDLAEDALVRLAERTRASATEWAMGVEARSRALLSEGPSADALYREAIERLGRTRVAGSLARSHLVYGEWLRRENRRVEAREELRLAHDMFVARGIDVFTERARRELLATGETVRKRTGASYFDLTAQEEEIARLAGSGLTNSEIGTQFFISARTVEWHLRKVFTKLGVGSRRELRGVLVDRVAY